jgi:hypothetical protein
MYVCIYVCMYVPIYAGTYLQKVLWNIMGFVEWVPGANPTTSLQVQHQHCSRLESFSKVKNIFVFITHQVGI